MAANLLLNCIKKLLPGASRRARRHLSKSSKRAIPTSRPQIELLEDRITPAGTVTNLLDAGVGSLRAALVGGGVVNFQPGLTGTITLASTLTISSDTTINGPGVLNGGTGIAIDGNNSVGVFHINSGTTDSISGLTIQHGNTHSGAGIYNAGTLTLSNDAISANNQNAAGTSYFNTGSAFGVGIWNSGTLTGNNLTIDHNWSYSDGGGIYMSGGSVTLSNTTIAFNHAYTTGGGIGGTGTLSLTNSTVADNSGFSGQSPGGVRGSGTTTINNTIISGNTGTDNSRTFTGTNNLIGGATGLAAALAFNGGPTQTLALAVGSNAIGLGQASQAGTIAANGYLRSTTPDIGAYQTAKIVTTLSDTGVGSLRAALPGGGTVVFQSGLTGTITLASTLSVSVSTMIAGPGPLNTGAGTGIAVDGNNAVGVFNFATGTTDYLSGLTLSHGFNHSGGGIHNAGNLNLSNVAVTAGNQNAAGTSYNGLGDNFGAGIWNSGTLTGNNVTIDHNWSYSDGGGIFMSGGSVTLSNSTIAFNHAYTTGGGIGGSGTLSLTNSTVADNSGFSGQSPGGLRGSGTTTINNSIISGNTGPDNSRTFTGVNNLIGGATGLASALAYNGGTTQTLALTVPSNAIRNGDPSQAGTISQNGNARAGFPDIGAYQGTGYTPTVTLNMIPVLNTSPSISISGTLFDTAPNNSVTFSDGLGDVITGVITAATPTSLTLNMSGLPAVPNNTPLYAVVTTDGISSGSPVQVANIVGTAVPPPVVTPNAANLADSASTITISGSNFSTTPSADVVTFDNGVVGTVTAATATQLTVAITTPPAALGSLNAVVNVTGLLSGAPVQVATVVNGTWVVENNSGVVGAGSVAQSLPYAVQHSLSGDSIAFDPAVFNVASPQTITLSGTAAATGEWMSIANNITITGQGANTTTIDGAHAKGIFNVPVGVSATISGLTMANGTYAASYSLPGGGNIRNLGTLDLENDTISGGSASYGGGVYNNGTLIVNGSTISANSGYLGGGYGSGIYNYTAGTATITNSTISGNTIGSGAGIYSRGTLTLTSDTIANNSSSYSGGGVYRSSGTVTMDNTIVAGNHSNGGSVSNDVFGTVASANYSLFGTTANLTISSGANNVLNANPTLSALAYNGGTTKTMALPVTSPAYHTGDPTLAGTTSQNAVLRIAPPSIGAFEYPPPVVNVNTTNLPTNSTTIYISGSNFDANPANDTVTFDNGLTGTVVTATTTLLGVSIPGLPGLALPVGTVLDASVTADGITSGTPPGTLVQVGTISATAPLPIVTPNVANIPYNATTLIITGSTFDPNPANDSVVFNLGVNGTVTSATSTQLTVTFSGVMPALGSLTATVISDGYSSGLPVQVATIIPPAVTLTTTTIPSNATTVIVTGSYFDTNPANDTVAFNLGAVGTVTAATPTQLTVTLSTGVTSLGNLTAVVTSDGFSSGSPVQVATVAPITLYSESLDSSGNLTITQNALHPTFNDHLSMSLAGGIYTFSDTLGAFDVPTLDPFSNISGAGTNTITIPITAVSTITITSLGSGTNTLTLTGVDAPAAPISANVGTAVGDAISVTGDISDNGDVSLTANTIALGAASISTSGLQAYNGAVTLSASTVLTSVGGGNITFASTVDGGHALTTNTVGITTFDGSVGATTPLTSITTGTVGTTVFGGLVKTTGFQAYYDPITLDGDTTFTSTGSGGITFSSTVDGADNLIVNTAGATTFSSAVGGTTALTSVTTDAAGSTILGANVSTSAAQTYGDAVTVGANIATNGSNVTFGGTVNSSPGNAITNGGFETGDFTGWTPSAVGGLLPVIRNTGAHTGTYEVNIGDPTGQFIGGEENGNSILTQSVAVPAGSPTLTFWVLRATSDSITFDWQDMYVIDANNVSHTVFHVCQTDGGWTQISVNMAPYAGTTVTLEFLVHGDGYGDQTNMQLDDVAIASSAQNTLTVNATGNATFGGAVGGSLVLGTLTVNSATMTAAAIATSGGLTVNDSGDASITGAITGGGSLSKLGVGTLTVSGSSPATSATVSAGTLKDNGTLGAVVNNAIIGGSGTTGALTDNGTVNPGLGATTVLNTGSLSFGPASIYSATLTSAGAAGTTYDQLSVTGGVDLSNSPTLQLNLGYVPAIGDEFTLIHNVSNTPIVGTFAGLPDGTLQMIGGVNWYVSYHGGSGNDFMLLRTDTLVTYADTLDAAGNLTITQLIAGTNDNLTLTLAGGVYTLSDPTLQFAAPAGAGAGFITGGFGTATPASISIPASQVTSITVTLGTGVNIFTMGASDAAVVPLTVDTGTGASGHAAIADPLVDSGAVSLTAPTITDNVTISSVSLALTGTIALNGGSITTTGAQTYTGAVTIGADTTTIGANVTFAGTVNSTPAVNAVTNPGFETGDLTGWTANDNPPLGVATVVNTTSHSGTYSVRVGDTGDTFSGSEQSGNDSISQVVAVPAGTPTLSFWVLRGTSDGLPFDWQDMYVIDASSVQHTVFHDCVSDAGWTQFTVDMTPYAGTNVTLEFLVHGDGYGDQTDMFVDDVTMLSQPHSLTVSATGTATFGGAVGASVALSSVAVTASAIDLNGGLLKTSGAQTYTGPVALGANATLTSTGSGNIGFTSTVDGADTLVVNTAGVTTFSSTIGGITPLVSVTTDAPGSTTLDANVTTTGAQTFSDSLTLGTSITFTSTGSGNITFGASVDGGVALVADTAGVTTFASTVGGTTPLTSITTDAAGTTALKSTVTTTGVQTYNDPVAITGNTTTNGSDVTFASTVTSTASAGGTYTESSTTYSWIDASVGGTIPVSGDDVSSGAFAMPIPFSYFGAPVTTVSVTTNGYMQLPGGNATTYPGQTLPYSFVPGGVFGWWTDLDTLGGFGGSGTIYQLVTGSVGSRIYTVEWDAVNTYNSNYGPPVTFEINFYEGSNNITMQYLTANSTTLQHTIGIQNPAANLGYGVPGQVATTAPIAANSAFLFAPVPGLPLYNLTVNATGATTFGGAVSVKSLSDNTATMTATSISANGSVTINDSISGTVSGDVALNLAGNLIVPGAGNTVVNGVVSGTATSTAAVLPPPSYVGFTGGTGGLASTQQILNWTYTSPGTTIDYSGGFATNNLVLNQGGANSGPTVVGSALQLTNGLNSEANTAWTPTTTDISSFTSTFQWTYGAFAPQADGFTFAAQANSSTIVGGAGGGLGYLGIGNSVAVAFNTYTGSGTGSGSDFGVDLNGVVAHTTNLVPFGINFHTNPSDTYQSTVVDDGHGNLTVSIWDWTTNPNPASPNYVTTVSLPFHNAVNTVTKSGTGTLTMSNINTYAGGTIVTGGILDVTGSIGDVAVSGGILGGPGTTGAISDVVGGTVNPGLGATNILNTGGLSGGGTYSFELNGTTEGTGYDQISATGSIDLTGATLTGTLGGGYVPAIGDVLTIIKNNNNTPITGTFAGMPEGTLQTVGGVHWVISYHGGAGNDVTLTRADTQPPTYTESLDGSGNLIITMEAPYDTANLLLTLAGGVYTFTDPTPYLFDPTATGAGAAFISGVGTSTITIPSANVTSITVTLGLGINVFTIGATDAPVAPLTVDTGSIAGDQVIVAAPLQDSGDLTLTSNAISLTGGSVISTGAQVYNGSVTIGADTTTTGSDVTFGGSVKSVATPNYNLTVTATGTATFDGTVGTGGALNNLAVTASAIDLDGGPVTTSGGQTYTGPVTLGANTTLTSTGSGNIGFTSTVDGADTLVINTAGVATFGGTVGGTTALTSVTTDSAGSTTLDGNVNTTGAQAYNDAVTLGASATFASTGSGNVTFNSTVDGAYALVVDTAGTTKFEGAIGATTALVSLATDAAGTTELAAGTVTTTGDQDYADPVTLKADTQINGANITFESTVGSSGLAYVGSYYVSQGPSWTTNPVCYTAQQAAALIFGGVASDYQISTNPNTTDPTTITHTGWYSTWGVGGGSTHAQDYVLQTGSGYNNPGGTGSATSAYVNDNAIGTAYTNYIWRGSSLNLTINSTAATTFGGTVTVKSLTDNTVTMTAAAITTVNGATINDSGAGSITDVISGGNLTKQGAGTLTLTSTSISTVNATIAAGTLAANGTIGDVLLDGATAVLGGSGTTGAVTNNIPPYVGVYQIDNGVVFTTFNNTLFSESEDNWVGNVFTAAAGGTSQLQSITFQTGSTALNATTLPDANITAALYIGSPSTGMTLVADSVYTMPLSVAANTFVTVPFATTESLAPGQVFTAALLINNVPNTVFPFSEANSGTSTNSYFDVDNPPGAVGTYVLATPNIPTPNGSLWGTSGSTNSSIGTTVLRANYTVANPSLGGTVNPGLGATSLLNTGSLSGTQTYSFKLDGATTPGADYDQISATGTIDLTGAALSVSLGYTPSFGDTYTIIRNVSDAPIVGNFTGYPEGSTITVGGVDFMISYVGNSANDVTLTDITPSSGVAPVVLTQPVSQSVPAGATVTFTSTASGTPTPTVQWEVSTNGGVTFTPISNGGVYSGATTTTLTITGVTIGMTGYEYEAFFTNASGQATSNPATLTVLQAPAVVSVVVNGGAPQYTDANGVQVSLAGQNSIVEQLLVTFNEPVTLDAGAFTISTNLANFQSLGGVELPNTDPVGLNAPIPVVGSGGTQFILTFLAGSGVNSIPGGVGTYIKDGVYNLNTIGSHVHANSQTAADNHAGFWALFGSVAADNTISGSIGDGNSDILVDTPDAAQFKIAFGTENDSSLLPDQPYDAAMDSNLSGVIGTEDAARFKHNFGTEWMF